MSAPKLHVQLFFFSPRTPAQLAVHRVCGDLVAWLHPEILEGEKHLPLPLGEVAVALPEQGVAIEWRAAGLQDPRHDETDETAKECEVNDIELYTVALLLLPGLLLLLLNVRNTCEKKTNEANLTLCAINECAHS